MTGLQLPPHVLKQTANDLKRVSTEFILTSVGLAWHGCLFRDTNFMSALELEANSHWNLQLYKYA